MTQWYIVTESGHIVNGVMTSGNLPPTDDLLQPGQIYKREEDCSQAQLDAYQYYNERP